MYLTPNQPYFLFVFTFNTAINAPLNADTPPSATLRRNGAVDVANAPPVTNPATGV